MWAAELVLACIFLADAVAAPAHSSTILRAVEWIFHAFAHAVTAESHLHAVFTPRTFVIVTHAIEVAGFFSNHAVIKAVVRVFAGSTVSVTAEHRTAVFAELWFSWVAHTIVETTSHAATIRAPWPFAHAFFASAIVVAVLLHLLTVWAVSWFARFAVTIVIAHPGSVFAVRASWPFTHPAFAHAIVVALATWRSAVRRAIALVFDVWLTPSVTALVPRWGYVTAVFMTPSDFILVADVVTTSSFVWVITVLAASRFMTFADTIEVARHAAIRWAFAVLRAVLR